jgi:hypothetical protein
VPVLIRLAVWGHESHAATEMTFLEVTPYLIAFDQNAVAGIVL